VVDGGKAGRECGPLQAVIADILAEDVRITGRKRSTRNGVRLKSVRVNLDKTGEFSLFRSVEGADGDAVFEEFPRFGETFAFQGEGGPVFFDGAVDGLPRESRFLGLWTRVFPGRSG
jgi:hypothetical protein